MSANLMEFGPNALILATNPIVLLVALGAASLIRSPSHAVLIVINLWLFMEVFATLMVPGYHFADLFWERLVACALQVTFAYGAVRIWRFWRVSSASVTVH